MAKYYKTKDLRETAKALQEIKKRTTQLLKDVTNDIPKTALNAAQIIEARAKEILTEKGHIVTGNLRRSINSQIVQVGITRVTAEVGTFVVYGPYIENLPERSNIETRRGSGGGYLFPAGEETFEQVTKFLADHGLKPHLEKWGR